MPDLTDFAVDSGTKERLFALAGTPRRTWVVINEEGTYRVYDLQGDYQQYSLGSEAAELGVIDARIHEDGLVALTGSLTFLEVKGWKGTRPLVLANPGIRCSILFIYHTNFFARVA